MATKKAPLVFTEKEKELAEKLREYAKKCNNTPYVRNLWEAAKHYGYDNYGEVPQRVRQCISSLAGIRSGVAKRRAAKIKVVPKPEDPLGVPTDTEWYKEVSESKNLRHGLHPEDEAGLIEHFENNQVQKK